MKCPHCGKVIELAPENYNGMLRAAIERRLEQYGYHENPERYRAYTSVRGVIKLKLPGINLKPGQLNEEDYQKAVAVLDKILPGIERNEQ